MQIELDANPVIMLKRIKEIDNESLVLAAERQKLVDGIKELGFEIADNVAQTSNNPQPIVAEIKVGDVVTPKRGRGLPWAGGGYIVVGINSDGELNMFDDDGDYRSMNASDFVKV